MKEDLWNSEDITDCSEIKDLVELLWTYTEMLGNAEQDMIMNFTGCMKPCQYKEYKLVWEERRPDIGKSDIWFEFADRKGTHKLQLTVSSC